MSKSRIVGLGIGVLAILAAFGIVMWQTANMSTNTAFAQSATATPTAAPAAGTTPTPAPQQQQQQQTQEQIGDKFWALLADKTGLDVDELKEQAVEARRDMIDEALASDRITSEQADAIKEDITADNIIAPISLGRSGSRPGNTPNNQQKPGQSGPFGGFGNGLPGRGFGGGMGGFGGLFGRGGMGGLLETLNVVADALKLEPQALVEQLSQGQSLAEIAEAQGVEESVVKQAIIDQLTAQIDEQLALGLISEVQANQLKARLTPESIDLSRGFRFNFNMTTPDQDSSQLFPGFDWGQTFGNLPADGSMPFEDVFGSVFGTAPNGGTFNIPFGDIQTQ